MSRSSEGNGRLAEDKTEERNLKMKDRKYKIEYFQKLFPGIAAGDCLNSMTSVVIKFYYNTWMKQIMILSKYADEEH